MPWKVNVGTYSMLIDDMSPIDLEKIAAKHSTPEKQLNWLSLAATPAMSNNAFYDIVALVARKYDEPIPDRPSTVSEARAFLSHIEMVPDDLPAQFDEGGFPLGEKDAPKTPGSSTSIERADGTPTRPGARH